MSCYREMDVVNGLTAHKKSNLCSPVILNSEAMNLSILLIDANYFNRTSNVPKVSNSMNDTCPII